jgi:O-antigen ligase
MDWIFLIVILISLVIFLFSFTEGQLPLRMLFYIWLTTFHIGPRSIMPMGIKIFFVEGITIVVFLLFFFRSNFYTGARKVLPGFSWFFVAACVAGVFMAITEGRSWIVILYEVRPFIFMVPVFYITYFGIKCLNIKLATIIKIFTGGCLILSLGGVIGYFFPSLAEFLLGGSVQGESVLLDTSQSTANLGTQTLMRGGGSFWGLLIISGYLALLFFPVMTQARYSRKVTQKVVGYGCCVAMAATIILCAHRSVWLGCLAGLAVYSYFRGAKGLVAGAIGLAIVFMLLPETFYLRFLSVSDQTKWAGRVGRYDYAWNMFIKNPFFGRGWGASGWVHNAALQIGANLGLFGLTAFGFWLGKLYLSVFKVYKGLKGSGLQKMVFLSFIASIIVYMGPMLGESVISWTFLMIPFWFFCAILHNFTLGNVQED